jgi:hypothetical protein
MAGYCFTSPEIISMTGKWPGARRQEHPEMARSRPIRNHMHFLGSTRIKIWRIDLNDPAFMEGRIASPGQPAV